MVQKIDLKNLPFVICGPGRVPDYEEIDLAGCVTPPNNTMEGIPVRVLPKQYSFSMKIGGTIFDVTTHFNANGRQSVLQQFRDLILSEHLV